MNAESIFAYGGNAAAAGGSTAPTGSRLVASGAQSVEEWVPPPTYAQRQRQAASKFCDELHADGSPCRARPAKGTGKCVGHARSVGLL